MNNNEIEKRERFRMFQMPNIDLYLERLYQRIKLNANIDDMANKNTVNYVPIGNIKDMNQEQRNLFYDIVKDCYNNLIKMPEIELENDEFVIKIYDSETNVIASKINLSYSELLNYLVVMLFIYIYKFQRVNIRLGELVFRKNNVPYKANYDYFTKLYTLIMRIPGMSERIVNLSTSIDSNQNAGTRRRKYRKRKTRITSYKKNYGRKKRVKLSKKRK
jgi:hypothetical protein